jgi:uncharacterized protein YndB with AHSA1/START domain
MSTNKDDRRGELSVSRVVDAPRDLVWQAFTEPEHLAAFWGGSYCRAWEEAGVVVGRARSPRPRWPIHGRESVCRIERRRYS